MIARYDNYSYPEIDIILTSLLVKHFSAYIGVIPILALYPHRVISPYPIQVALYPGFIDEAEYEKKKLLNFVFAVNFSSKSLLPYKGIVLNQLSSVCL